MQSLDEKKSATAISKRVLFNLLVVAAFPIFVLSIPHNLYSSVRNTSNNLASEEAAYHEVECKQRKYNEV